MNKFQNNINLDILDKNYTERKQNKLKQDLVYPWNNYDFNLQQLITNNYNPTKIGFSDKPYLSTFIKDLNNLPKYPSILVETPILNSNTKAGVSDVDPTNTKLLNLKRKFKEFKEPYPGFKQEYPQYFPLTGEKSSSYFVKIGYCPVKSKTIKKDCIENGYEWFPKEITIPNLAKSFYKDIKNKKIDKNTDGNCYKPRYLYINNKSKPILGMNGLITNLTNNIESINPMDLIGIFTNGESKNKDMQPLPCIEGFSNKKKINKLIYKLFFVLLCLILLFIFYFKLTNL